MSARPEPTPLSFFGKLLVFPANVRLDWKVIACYKHSSLFGLINSDKGKKFYNIGPWSKHFNDVTGPGDVTGFGSEQMPQVIGQ